LETLSPNLDLGTIRGGQQLHVSFTFSNGGSEKIEIEAVDRGCDCLTPRLDKRLLEPGGKATLLLDIRTLGHPDGPHSWTAKVRYRERDIVRELPLSIGAVVVNDVSVQPAVCGISVEKTIRQEVTVTDRRRPALKVTRAESSTASIKVEVNNLDGGIAKITLEANGQGITPGRHDEMLSIYTDDPLYAHLQVPITLIRPASHGILATPERWQLPFDPNLTLYSTLIRLRPRADKAVAIDKVAADDPAVTCNWASGPGNHATLKIQVRTQYPLDAKVRVHFRDAELELLVIPVQIQLR